MPEFLCKLGAPGGAIVEKVMESESENALRDTLGREGYHVFRIEKRHPLVEATLGLVRRRKNRIPHEDFLVFNQELAALLKAGLPITHGLDILLERMKPGLLKDTIERVSRQVREGKTLSEAFEACGDLFEPIYYASLRAGEQSGNLQEVVRRYISYAKISIETRRRIVSMLIYPAILVGVAIGVVALLMIYVLPNFMKIYADFNRELPFMTSVTMGISNFMVDYSAFIAAALVGGAATYAAYRQTPRGRVQIDLWKLKLPFVGPLAVKFNSAQYARTLATLLAGGIPAVHALGVAARSLGNAGFVERLEGVVERVKTGNSMHASIEETGLFEHLAVEMIKIGESTGAVVEMLQNLSDFYDQDISVSLARFVVVLEPIVLLALAAIVGFVVISLYLPIFETIRLA